MMADLPTGRTAAEMVSGLQEQLPELFLMLQEAVLRGGDAIELTDEGIMFRSDYGNRYTLGTGSLSPAEVLQEVRKTIPDSAEEMDIRREAMPMFAGGACMGSDADGRSRISLAQWAITQFLQMKQFAIVQDLRRVPDEYADGPDPRDDTEAWKTGGQTYRPAKAELTDVEEQLYNTALMTIRDWLRQPESSKP